MIDELAIRNLALIRAVALSPAEGLTAITGETGAGKTALLKGLRLLTGARGQAQDVREGAEALTVEGRLFTGGDAEDGHVVSRRLSATGRGRIAVDGAMASVAELASGLGRTVDVCSQHEQQRLLSPHTHVAAVDAWAAPALEGPLAAWDGALRGAREAAAELARIEELARSADERHAEAAFALARIDEVGPEPGEADELRQRLSVAERADELRRAAASAREAVMGDEGAVDRLSEALSALDAITRTDARVSAIAASLQGALIEAEDAAQSLRSWAEGIESDPESLELMRERLAALSGLMRTWGPSLDDVLATRARAAEVVEVSENLDEHLARAERARDEAEERLARAADALDEARDGAAASMLAEVNRQLERLEMRGAELLWSTRRLPRAQWGPTGPSETEFLYRSARALTPRPLAKVASGGELSRLMLALKVVQGATDVAQTLVFDEVDAGVGGTAAEAVATLVAELASTHQVICVTHLAQLAARADTHLVVTKEGGEGDAIPETSVREVEGEERVAELARMLSGRASEASMAHARELLGP